jgi:hypothetical protein
MIFGLEDSDLLDQNFIIIYEIGYLIIDFLEDPDFHNIITFTIYSDEWIKAHIEIHIILLNFMKILFDSLSLHSE